MHWACEKITASPAIPDAVLLEQLLDKVGNFNADCYTFHIISSYYGEVVLQLQLKLCKGISYAAIAAHADNSGRRKLAAMLVDHELQPSKQACLICRLTIEYFLCIHFCILCTS